VTRRWGMAALVLVLAAAIGRAQVDPAPDDGVGERITDFHSHIVVDRDGGLTVSETIAVVAAGEQINHGIYRDFPTTYEGPLFTRVEVPFESSASSATVRPSRTTPRRRAMACASTSARRTPRSRPGRTPTGSPTARPAARLLRRPRRAVLERHRQRLGVPDRARLGHRPAAARCVARAGRARGYTGPAGSTLQALTTEVDRHSGALHFATTRSLDPYEGLTIVASFPKGHVHEPTAEERRAAWLRSNRHLVAGAAGLAVVLLYYLAAWLAVGRDPSRGTIIPLFEPRSLSTPPACATCGAWPTTSAASPPRWSAWA